jgi:hypothetical protein
MQDFNLTIIYVMNLTKKFEENTLLSKKKFIINYFSIFTTLESHSL